MKNAQITRHFFRRAAADSILGLLDQIPDVSFFVKNNAGQFIALNERGCEYCGVSRQEEAIGKTDHDFFPAQRADAYRADDLTVLRSGEAIVNRLESAPEDDGSPRMVVTSKVPVRDEAGKIIGIAGFSRQVDQIRSGTVSAFSEVIETMHREYASPLTSERLARLAGLSVSQFERRFRKALNATPMQYLIRIRIEKAAQALLESDESITRIAVATGFYDHAHFSRTFRRLKKCSPSQYRARSPR
ncbi:MAG: helix-turn-helix domain-containing protein [Planctomycetota bacterium]